MRYRFSVKPRKKAISKRQNPRRVFSGFVTSFRDEPFEFLPERTVNAVNSFFDGYGVFMGVNADFAIFKEWVMKQLFYVQNMIGKCLNVIDLFMIIDMIGIH